MRVLLLCDGSALPGTPGGDLRYEQTFGFLLFRKLALHSPEIDLLENARPGLTLQDITRDWFETIELRKIDVLILRFQEPALPRRRWFGWQRSPALDLESGIREVVDRAQRCAIRRVVWLRGSESDKGLSRDAYPEDSSRFVSLRWPASGNAATREEHQHLSEYLFSEIVRTERSL